MTWQGSIPCTNPIYCWVRLGLSGVLCVKWCTLCILTVLLLVWLLLLPAWIDASLAQIGSSCLVLAVHFQSCLCLCRLARRLNNTHHEFSSLQDVPGHDHDMFCMYGKESWCSQMVSYSANWRAMTAKLWDLKSVWKPAGQMSTIYWIPCRGHRVQVVNNSSSEWSSDN